MSQPLVYKTATVTATGSATSLLTLLQAIDPTIPAFCRELNLQADPANSTNNVLIGDDQLSTSRLGVALTNTTQRNYRSSGATSEIPLANIFILASASSPKLNVEILP